MTRVCIIQGHPTAGGGHFCHALAEAYSQSATTAGHEVRTLCVAEMDFLLLRSKEDWDKSPAPDANIVAAQETIRWAEHLLIVHPLWIGAMPALLKGFFEQALRPGFAYGADAKTGMDQAPVGPQRTCGGDDGYAGPYLSLVLRRTRSQESTQNLALVGIRPRRSILVGMIEAMSDSKRRAWLDHLRALGRRAA